MTRLAGALALLAGLGFGIPGAIGTRILAARGEVWSFLGFPTYGGGPFTAHGLDSTVPLMLGFVAVCAAEVVVGVLLLAGWPPALWLQFALLPVELVYWWGFALPFGFVFGVARAAAAVVALAAGR